MDPNEYLPNESEHPPHSSNGNGHGKVFRLAPVESAAEEARDNVIRKIAPQIRRDVRNDTRVSPGAAFFFYCLLDDCFWHQVGGHGTGRIYASLKDLADRYHHHKDTVARWRDELINCEWLYCRDEWPLTEWRLTPLMPAPENSPHQRAVQMSLGRAASVDEQSRKLPLSPSNGEKPNVSASPAASSGRAKPQLAARAALSYGSQSRKLRLGRPKLKAGKAGKLRPTGPKLQADPAVQPGRPDPQVQADPALSCGPSPSFDAGPLERNGCREKSPGVTSIGELETVHKAGTRVGAGLVTRAIAATQKETDSRQGTPSIGNVRDFLTVAEATFGCAEMKRNGGLWVTLFREDRNYLIRCLLETRVVKRETPELLKTTWAAYCMDLWKAERLGKRKGAR